MYSTALDMLPKRGRTIASPVGSFGFYLGILFELFFGKYTPNKKC